MSKKLKKTFVQSSYDEVTAAEQTKSCPLTQLEHNPGV